MLRTNRFDLVGTLLTIESKTNKDRSGREYISVDVTIGAKIGDKNCVYPVNFFAYAFNSKGESNKLFETYQSLETHINHKVSVSGSLGESRYVSKRTKELGSVNTLNGRWVNLVASTEPDKATFELGGFLVTELTEKQNKEGAIYRYDIKLGQSNYKEDNCSVFTLNVDPADTAVRLGLAKFTAGSTFTVYGDLVFTENVVQVESTNTAFGAPVTRTFVNHNYAYNVKSGSLPLEETNDDGTANEDFYSTKAIKLLLDAYKARDVELMNGAKNRDADNNNDEGAAASSNTKLSTRQASLL